MHIIYQNLTRDRQIEMVKIFNDCSTEGEEVRYMQVATSALAH